MNYINIFSGPQSDPSFIGYISYHVHNLVGFKYSSHFFVVNLILFSETRSVD